MTGTSSRLFGFPLNVYARTIELEFGEVRFLHYGLFESPAVPANVAQEAASQRLWQQLPPPCQMLDVGIGLGTTLHRLCDAGYTALGITSDPAQIDAARQRHGEDFPVQCMRLEDMPDPAVPWDAMLFQESAKYVNVVDLFENADRLLSVNGEILVMDEFVVSPPSADTGSLSLHRLDHFLAAGQRAGFFLQVHENLDALAAPTLEWLLEAISRHADVLQRELDLTPAEMQALATSKRNYQSRYACGFYGYRLLRFRRSHRTPWRIGRIPSDATLRATEMRALFSDVFGHEMSAEEREWKYGGGRGRGIGIWRNDGTLVGHYGGISRPSLMFGEPVLAFQACDLMVATSERGKSVRKGPAFLAIATFLEQELGYGSRHLIGIGFPNTAAYRLPELLGLYQGQLARIHSIRWPASKDGPSLWIKVREADPTGPDFKEFIDSCWMQMAKSLVGFIIGVRDADYICHRYLSHPDKQYRFFQVRRRWVGQPLAFIVIRQTESGDGELLDIVGNISEVRHAIQQARRIAASLGCPSIFAWITNNMLDIFRDSGESAIDDLDVLVPGNNWTAGPDSAVLINKWWLTGGDTDFH